MLWVRISIRARCTTLCDKVCKWLETGQWFSPGTPVSSTNKTDRHNITKILLKEALQCWDKLMASIKIWQYNTCFTTKLCPNRPTFHPRWLSLLKIEMSFFD
jgi:hypothetical protein